MEIPKNLKGKELFDFLTENKEDLVYAKKNTIKTGDSLSLGSVILNKERISSVKNEEGSDGEIGQVKVRAIINTTNVMDSHKDVHIDGIWDKSLSENKRIKFLQEHQMRFDKVIADKDDLEVSVNKVTWKSLGFDMDGKTEALTFDATVKRERNKFMYNEYKNKNVDEHSVGMRYIKIKLAINSDDEDYASEKEVWDKYYPIIANKDEADKYNYFWAVTEAKVIEGSAVLMGSNSFTPTLSQSKDTDDVVEESKLLTAVKGWLDIE